MQSKVVGYIEVTWIDLIHNLDSKVKKDLQDYIQEESQTNLFTFSYCKVEQKVDRKTQEQTELDYLIEWAPGKVCLCINWIT